MCVVLIVGLCSTTCNCLKMCKFIEEGFLQIRLNYQLLLKVMEQMCKSKLSGVFKQFTVHR